MKNIAVFDTKPYDRIWFDRLCPPDFNLRYLESKLDKSTARLAQDCEGAIAFVNDHITKEAIDGLCASGVEVLAMRCAGYNNIDFRAAFNRLHVLRVPEYSPYAVAEHAIALLLCLNRKIHRAYNRTREFNFSLNGLMGFDLHGKTIGVIGTGRIGKTFIGICRSFGMRVLAYDPHHDDNSDIEYLPLSELFPACDIISLHCPLTKQTNRMIDRDAIARMKKGVFILNTSRGGLIDSEALLEGLREGKIGAAALDVYEEESELFYEDYSDSGVLDEVLALLVSMPNVLVTSHQAFFTNEALEAIARVTFENLTDYFAGRPLKNEICYRCRTKGPGSDCQRTSKGRCF